MSVGNWKKYVRQVLLMKKIKRFMKKVPWCYKYLLIFCGCNLIASVVYPCLKVFAEIERGYGGAVGGECAVWFIGPLVLLIIDTIRIGRSKDETQED